MSTVARLVPVITFTVALSAVAPPPAASADKPPAIDNTLLPPAATPKPPEPTERDAECAVFTFDPHLNASTQLASINLPALWALSTGEGQKVAVIDTGVSAHPQLPRLIAGGDYVFTGDDGREDCDGHGTAVAGIVAATPDPGADVKFAGIAPAASIIAIRQSSEYYRPFARKASGMGDVDTMAMAVRRAADLGATVINISTVACNAGAGLRDRALGAAVAYAVDVKDAVVIVAAGNVGPGGRCPQQNPPPNPAHPNEPDWESAVVAVSPGWYDDYVLTVGSVTVDGSVSSFSLAGPWVDVAAPGEAVVSLNRGHSGLANTRRGTDGFPIMGTSYAAPVVSGLAALVRARFPDLSARQVMQRIKTTAHHPPGGWNPFVGNGIVDLSAALSDRPPTPTTVSPSASQHPTAPSSPPPPPQTTGRATAFTGIAGCAALLAAALALMAPVNRLARRRTPRVGGHPVVND
ncbi:MAG TPA: type VII secretion-associated serine protease mycosin [Mycobacterium sp.]|nr:type VII secretion-associated serine protease mycosin [Mycobacterium sp.]